MTKQCMNETESSQNVKVKVISLTFIHTLDPLAFMGFHCNGIECLLLALSYELLTFVYLFEQLSTPIEFSHNWLLKCLQQIAKNFQKEE